MFRAVSLALRTNQPATLALRLAAGGSHLTLSLVVAALAFALVHFVWYPREYWSMAGGRELFFLVVSVDVVVGPIVTTAIFNPAKGTGRMRFDLVVIGVLQVAALVYGLWTVSIARPAFLVFTGDRFNMVTAVALDPADLAKAERVEFAHVPWLGPRLVGTRRAKEGDEKLQLISDALAGKDVELQPKFYVPYDPAPTRAVVQPIAALKTKNPIASGPLIDAEVARTGRPERALGWLPVIARGDWVALVDRDGGVPLRFLPLNGF